MRRYQASVASCTKASHARMPRRMGRGMARGAGMSAAVKEPGPRAEALELTQEWAWAGRGLERG